MKYQEIKERASQIAAEPVKGIDREKLDKVYSEFKGKTRKSALLAERIKESISQGSQHTLPPSLPYPLFMDRGKGSRITDVDGNSYIDYILSGGAILLGHNYEYINSRILDLIKEKTNFHGFFDEMEIKTAEKIKEYLPSVEKLRFTSSGAEANMAALRMARSFTGKKKIIKFRGAYHGWADPFMTDMEIPGSGRFLSQGVPAEILDLTVLCYANDLTELEELFQREEKQGGIAAVIVEPVGGESGLVPFEEGFHSAALEITHRHGALYIFDEVVTGLRLGLGGAQEILGIRPDITILGKALMNGFPSCGAVGGKGEIMDTLSTGLPGETPYAYIAGTLSGNTLSMAAAYYTFCALEQPGVLENLFFVAGDYVKKLNSLFEAHNSRFFAYNFGGIIRIELTAPHAVPISSPEAMREIIFRRSILREYSLILHNRGILSRMGRDMISCSHTAEDNDKAVSAFEELLDALV